MSTRAAINLSTRTIKIYSSAYDAQVCFRRRAAWAVEQHTAGAVLGKRAIRDVRGVSCNRDRAGGEISHFRTFPPAR